MTCPADQCRLMKALCILLLAFTGNIVMEIIACVSGESQLSSRSA